MTNKITRRIISAMVALTTVATFSVASIAEEADPRAEVAKAAYERIVQEKGLNPANPYHKEVWLTAMQEAGYVPQYTGVVEAISSNIENKFGVFGTADGTTPTFKDVVAATVARAWSVFLINKSSAASLVLELDTLNHAALPVVEKGLPYLELLTYTKFFSSYVSDITMEETMSIIETAEGMVTDGKTNKEVVEFLLQEASARVTV